MSFNLAFFNGDVRRDRKQEAMLKSMNERDNFLNRLQEMERKRELDEKQEKASRRIQKIWRSHVTRQKSRQELREIFDKTTEETRSRTPSDVQQMSQLVVNFYSSKKDEERLIMTLVELVKARTANKDFDDTIPVTRRLLLARCCIKFLKLANENTIFFHVFRFLEDFVTSSPNLLEAVAEMGLFEGEFHLFEALLGKREEKIEKGSMSPRHLQLLSRIFDAFVNTSRKTNVTVKTVDRLFRVLCVTIPSDVFTNYMLYYISDHIKPSSHNYDIFIRTALAVKLVNWKVPVELKHNTSSRIRSLLLSQTESISQGNQDSIKIFFDSLAVFLDKNTISDCSEHEDLSQNGRLRTAATRHLEDYCENVFNSDEFRRAACIYSFSHPINIETIISMRSHFTQLLDSLSSSDAFVGGLYTFIVSQSVQGEIPLTSGKSPVTSALILFCNCLNRRISSVADSDFVPSDIFGDFDHVVEFLRDISIKLVNLMFPNIARSDLYKGNMKQRERGAVMDWKKVSEAVFAVLGAIHQKDIRIKHLPENFWTNHGRQVLVGLGDQTVIRRRLRRSGVEQERTVDSEFVERLAKIYESEDDDSDDEEEQETELPQILRRAIVVMRHIPFVVPFMDRVQLFNRLLLREREIYYHYDPNMERWGLSIRRDHIYLDAFEEFAPKLHRDQKDRVKELKSHVKVKMVNWIGMNEGGVDGGGIFREFLSELLKHIFDVESAFFTFTEGRLLYPNPTAPFLFGADCARNYQFIGRMIGKLLYERQLQEVRFAEFFIAQIFESDKNKDVDLQHMKSFDPLIFKHLKNLLSLGQIDLEDLQLDFSIVTNDLGLVRTVNLKPNGSNHRVTVDNVHEYVRLYVNYHLKFRIAPMVDALRRGVSELINIEWMRMFAPHELQLLIAGNEQVFTAKEMRKYCEMRFSYQATDLQYMEMFWDVVDKLSPEDKKALLKFVTGCSRPPVDGFKSLYPRMGIVVGAPSDDQLPTSATCMNMLTIPLYSTRARLEEKLRYAINSGAGFELA